MKRAYTSPSITLAIPLGVVSFFSRFRQFISRPLTRFNFRYIKEDGRKNLSKILLVLVAVILVGYGMSIILRSGKPGDTRVVIKPAKVTQSINKELSFPLKDDKGKVVTTITYTIEAAELRDEIVVKGQRASSVKGRTFLVIPIKINNTYSQAIEIQAKDYVRLMLNGNDKELLAADIHNDPVTIQASSTKSTRLGFPINDTDKNMVLRVGELNGTKEDIAIAF